MTSHTNSPVFWAEETVKEYPCKGCEYVKTDTPYSDWWCAKYEVVLIEGMQFEPLKNYRCDRTK